jgi:amino acid adenylation domain-containing protein
VTGGLVHDLLAASGDQFPDRTAVVDRDSSLTYAELEQAANRLGRLLIEHGVEPGDRVGLFIDKSIEALVGIYATMKAGAVYVPFDPQAPPARLAYMAMNADVRCLVTGKEKRGMWAALIDGGAAIETFVVLNASSGDLEDRPGGARILTAEALDAHGSDSLRVPREISDLANILYTSGSTGDPKGVMLSHLNARSFVDWAADEFAVTADDRLSSHAPLHFDLSVFDLFAAASGGAAVVLVPAGISVFPFELARFIEAQAISVWYSVPSALTTLVLRGRLDELGLDALRTVLFAGEVFPTKYLLQLMKLLPGARFCNLYGPTETNVCTWYDVPRTPLNPAKTIPIGRPIPGVEAFAATGDGEPVAPGEVGELRVKGPTVMQGYWNDPARTAQVLLDTGRPDERMYRTGDLVQETLSGDFLFLGRRDTQIKSRGYRIELGDVETALNAHPLVAECAVVPVPDELFTNTLRACVVALDGATKADLVAFCRERLPGYMVPDVFQFRETLPKSSTGKIDRLALAAEQARAG